MNLQVFDVYLDLPTGKFIMSIHRMKNIIKWQKDRFELSNFGWYKVCNISVETSRELKNQLIKLPDQKSWTFIWHVIHLVSITYTLRNRLWTTIGGKCDAIKKIPAQNLIIVSYLARRVYLLSEKWIMIMHGNSRLQEKKRDRFDFSNFVNYNNLL